MATTLTTDEECQAELLPFRKELLKAIISGVRTARHGSKEITYRSLSEMKEALSKVESELEACGWVNPSDSTRRRKRSIKVYARRPH